MTNVTNSSAGIGVQTRSGKIKRSFPEGKTYIIVVLGFVTCLYLTNVWLPALGLRTLAREYEGVADFIAPYLLLPICLVISVQTLRRSLLPGILAIVGSLIIDYYFFIRYNEFWSWVGLATIGIAILVNYVLYRLGKRMFLPAPVLSSTARWRMRLTLASVYVVSFLLAVYLGPITRYVSVAGPLGRDLRYATATVPTLIVLLVYLVYKRLRFASS